MSITNKLSLKKSKLPQYDQYLTPKDDILVFESAGSLVGDMLYAGLEVIGYRGLRPPELGYENNYTDDYWLIQQEKWDIVVYSLQPSFTPPMRFKKDIMTIDLLDFTDLIVEAYSEEYLRQFTEGAVSFDNGYLHPELGYLRGFDNAEDLYEQIKGFGLIHEEYVILEDAEIITILLFR